MAYIPIPASGADIPAQSQPQFYANFLSIQALIGQNHVTFDLTGQGKHKLLQMPEQSTSGTTAVDEMAMYVKESSVSGSAQAEMFMRRENNGDEYIFTGRNTSATQGYTQLPSGILMYWGSGQITSPATTVSLIFASGTIPLATNGILSVQLTAFTSTGPTFIVPFYWDTSVAATSSTIQVSSVGIPVQGDFKYLILGY